MLKKKTNSRGAPISEGALVVYSTEDFTLLKGVQSFLTHDRFIPSRFVPKFSPFVLSLSRFVPEIFHARVREHISVVANDEKVESGEKDSNEVRCVYL